MTGRSLLPESVPEVSPVPDIPHVQSSSEAPQNAKMPEPEIDWTPLAQSVAAEMVGSSVKAGWQGARWRLTCNGLPKNSRQTREGYWIGSRPDAAELEELHERGVQLLITAATIPSRPRREFHQTIEKLGMTDIYMPFGSTFPHPSKFMEAVNQYEPSQIYIHCEHGGDRSGAILAYILATRHFWPISEALYAVIVPTPLDIRSLSMILREADLTYQPELFGSVVGMYSAENNGGFGGMKVRHDGGSYHNLVVTLIRRLKQMEE